MPASAREPGRTFLRVRHLRAREDGADAGDGADHRQPGRSRRVDRMHGFRRVFGRSESLQRLHHDGGCDHLRSVPAASSRSGAVCGSTASLSPAPERAVDNPTPVRPPGASVGRPEGAAIQGRGWSKRPRLSLGAPTFLELRRGEDRRISLPRTPEITASSSGIIVPIRERRGADGRA
jgi:hypothetical protein